MSTNRKSRILLIEDDDIVRDVLAEVLRAAGYETIAAADGINGLMAVKNEKPDLTVLDLNLPDLSGVDLAGMIQQDTAFIVLTVDKSDDSVKACDDRGALGYSVKPLKADDFLRNIQLAISRGRELKNLRCALQQTQSINKAIGMLVGHLYLPEEVASKALLLNATRQRMKVSHLADQVIGAFQCITTFYKAGYSDKKENAEVAKAREFLEQFRSDDPCSEVMTPR